MSKPTVTIYSDNICPYCTIGAKRLSALEKELNFKIEWKAFEIHPDTPKEGMLTSDYFKNMDFDQMKNRIEEFGDDVNMKVNGNLLANSKLSLAANNFAQQKGKFSQFHEGIFKANFEEGKNIGDLEVLLEIAEESGLDREELTAFLSNEKNLQDVTDSSKEAQALGITGVPTFIINNKAVVGAQPTEVLREFLQTELAVS
ncbi:MAG: putative DsbA family dithiol-disulfide isomerase [Parvicellaceae bacterium]|jgi:predicted DsbA family dithiol-disulfide isomerase